jgi:predicted O-methyltransferase YrrM
MRKQVPRSLYGVWFACNRRGYATSLGGLRVRTEIPHLLNARGLVGDAAEIGVKRGRYSEHLLRHWRGRRLISIDPWAEAAATEYVDRANVGQAVHERYHAETHARLARFGSRSEIWRTTSLEAAARVEDASLDFVYIDARHDYDSVREDVLAWLPKVRPGGILAGHDYADGTFVQGEFGVKRAVDEIAAERGLTVHATDGRPRVVELFPSWLVEIPRT